MKEIKYKCYCSSNLLPTGIHCLPYLTIEAATFSKTAASVDPKNFGPKLDEFQEPRFLEQVKLFFDRAASKTDIPQEYLNLIKACNTVIRFNIPLRRDNGTIDTITCYR